MPEPVMRMFRIQDTPFNPGTSTYVEDIAYMNAGGPVAEEIIPGGTGTVTKLLDFKSAQAGMWAKPQILVFQFDGDSVVDLGFWVFDKDSNKEDMYPVSGNRWDFRIKLSGHLYDPNDQVTLQSNLGSYSSWPVLPAGSGATPYSFDSNLPNPLNRADNTGGVGYPLLIKQATNNTVWRTNFYIYLTAKPQTNAQAGEHINWGFRAAYNYPGGA